MVNSIRSTADLSGIKSLSYDSLLIHNIYAFAAYFVGGSIKNKTEKKERNHI